MAVLSCACPPACASHHRKPDRQPEGPVLTWKARRKRRQNIERKKPRKAGLFSAFPKSPEEEAVAKGLC